ncbi:BSD domain containing protein [Trema orientale]|uniref:BSD domain containing protein n=1 Tax=Trema orientale TaxID=63057 RepID=A0A2P5BVQ6_TREOI|nr:BSD domain containing protein [Trema orientale]
MDFFKSVFSDNPDPPQPESTSGSPQNPPNNQEREDPDPVSGPDHAGTDGGGAWSFGGLIKSLATKSESVIETYRRDLQEFGSGLKKEIEVAHGSLGTVGHAIDELGNSVLKGTAQIISQGKDAILADDHESDSSDTNNTQNYGSQQSLNSKRYSRFDAQVRAFQGEASTYCDEPEDLDDYNKWKLGFVLEEKNEEIEGLLEENRAIEGIYKRVVPDSLDHQTFWCRYFYKVFRLKQAEDLRANLVKRAISREEEEELSWEVDDDDDEGEDEDNAVRKPIAEKNGELGNEDGDKAAKEVRLSSSNEKEMNIGTKEGNVTSNDDLKEENSVDASKNGVKVSNVDEENRGSGAEKSSGEEAKQKVHLKENVGSVVVGKKGLEVSKADDKVALEGQTETGESSKDSDVTVVSTQPSVPEEEDLGWDEIEDLSSIDDKKVTHSGSPNRTELRKRLSAAEEDEDLSWDIEDDDDEPSKT